MKVTIGKINRKRKSIKPKIGCLKRSAESIDRCVQTNDFEKGSNY